MKYPNGSESILSKSPWCYLVAIKNCPCEDKISRTVRVNLQPETFFSIGGRISVRGKTVSGYVTCGEDGYSFHARKSSKNYKYMIGE